MSTGSRATTIAEVARQAGVSPATVSRVMNGRFLGEPHVEQRVRSVAQELNYWPNFRARSFALGKTNTVAFLVPDLSNPAFHAALTGLSSAAAEDAYRALVADSAESADDERLLATELRGRCDALVLCAPRMDEDDLVRVTEELAPVVLLNRSSPRVSAPTIAVDSHAGIERLARHLYDLGHRRIAYLEGPAGVANANRLKGIADVTEATSGIEIVRIAGGAGSRDGLDAAAAVAEAEVTAVLAFNDLVAIGLVHGLLGRGIRVPDDISVTGFDDIAFAQFMSPSLTTVSVPHEELGVLAWERMRALIEGTTPKHDVLFQPRLEVRESTAPPPRAD
ncbi:LacI family transcriptional regulator [Microbacterium protaetiae]|uniref:LacI family transcriptional regulator n=1 Tax=Microbacterium protaetiae TaxID=2509458 RepID=A0A4V0YD08_9MICO|nr:LacI family DNA-binding transcriptional regulator [Microbacterium protaetiae]QAY59061.1 LacI family transcriptional regulator [Microbacterium protaetiae]